MVKPISPVEAEELRLKTIPDEVYEAFNALIVDRWDGESAVVTQPEVSQEIKKRLKASGKSPRGDFSMSWLDVEPAYRKEGWSVDFEKPGYNETFSARFIFKKKKKGSSG